MDNSSGVLVIKTKIDTDGYEKDLDELVDITKKASKDAGEDLGEGIEEGVEEATKKSSNTIGTALAGALAKATGTGKGLLTVIKSIGAIAGKVAIMVGVALAVVGAIVVGVLLIAKAVKKIYNENEQFRSNIQYIIWAIKQAIEQLIEPALKWIGDALINIVNIIVQILKYTAAVIKLITGKNIFEKASAQAFADSMKQADESTGGIASNLKEAKKQLAGFDEMNVLQDNSGGGGGGVSAPQFTMPDFDLSDIGDAENKIKEFTKSLEKGFEDLRKAAKETPIEDYIDEFGLYGISIKGLLQTVYGEWEIWLGQWDIVGGLYDLIVAFFTGDDKGIEKALDKIWGGLQKWAEGSQDRVIGILEIIAGLFLGSAETTWNLLKPLFTGLWDWLVENIFKPIGEKVGEVLAPVVETVTGIWETIKGVIGIVAEWVKTTIIDPVVEYVTGLWNTISEGINFVLEIVTSIIDTIWSNVEIMIDNIVQIVNFLIEKAKEIIEPIIAWIVDNIVNPISKFFTDLWNDIVDGVKSAINSIREVVIKIASWVDKNIIKPIAKFFTGLWNDITKGVEKIKEKVETIFSKIVSYVSTAISSIVKLFKDIGTKVGDAIGGAFKTVVNGVLGAVETILNAPIRAINKLVDVINKVPGLNLSKLNTFSLPRLAQGGIVNNPGPGVMMGSYIAGERGPEAVLPLTDEVFDRLGIAIGRHTSINATIPVYVGNRQVARELRRIDAEDNFAFNR